MQLSFINVRFPIHLLRMLGPDIVGEVLVGLRTISFGFSVIKHQSLRKSQPPNPKERFRPTAHVWVCRSF